MRIIDADAIELKARMGINEDGLLFIPYADVKKSIDNTPTIEPADNKLAKCKDIIWEMYKNNNQGKLDNVICDNCPRRNEDNECPYSNVVGGFKCPLTFDEDFDTLMEYWEVDK